MDIVYYIMGLSLSGVLSYFIIMAIKLCLMKAQGMIMDKVIKKNNLNKIENRNFRVIAFCHDDMMVTKILLPAVVLFAISLVGFLFSVIGIEINDNLFTKTPSGKIIVGVLVYTFFVIAMYLESLSNQFNRIAKNIDNYTEIIKGSSEHL